MIATASSVSSWAAKPATWVRRQFGKQGFPNIIVHLGQHLAGQARTQRGGERQPVAFGHQLDQVGEVGGVQRFGQSLDERIVALVGGIDHVAHEGGFEPVVLVQPVGRVGGERFGGERVGGDVAHGRLLSSMLRCRAC